MNLPMNKENVASLVVFQLNKSFDALAFNLGCCPATLAFFIKGDSPQTIFASSYFVGAVTHALQNLSVTDDVTAALCSYQPWAIDGINDCLTTWNKMIYEWVDAGGLKPNAKEANNLLGLMVGGTLSNIAEMANGITQEEFKKQNICS